jgi:hypothetical protein
MSKTTLLYNKSNPFGISKDVEAITHALGATGLTYADPLEPPAPTDLAIHLEIPVYAWMPWATRNVLVVNPEWFQAAWIPYMHRFSAVIYKDPFSAEEAVKAGHVTAEQVRVVPWGCPEPAAPAKPPPRGNKNTGFVWFLGNSANKRAYVPELVRLWRQEYPPLRIYSVEPVDVSGIVVPSNVRFEARDLDQQTREGLSRFFRGHIACSRAEGFGYVAAEAEWNGAFTILNELNCYRADYAGDEGAHFLEAGSDLGSEACTEACTEAGSSLEDIMTKFEATDFDALALRRSTQAAKRWSDFLSAFGETIRAVRNMPAVKLGPLPPILMPADCPQISIVTLMYNRRRFFDLACHNMMMSDYPKDKIEWIIVEDSDDPMEDASDRIVAVAAQAAPLRIVYVPLKKKTSVAAKRNMGVQKATADIVLMMDDDDHYPETSFRRRVAWLTKHPWEPKAVAATTIACYDLIQGISAVNVPPMDIPLGQRVSEATLTFYKAWWGERGFPTAVQVGEGEEFVAGREKDVLEVPPQQMIVAFSHGKNTSSRRIPGEGDRKPGCFWGFPPEYLKFVHELAGVKVVAE